MTTLHETIQTYHSIERNINQFVAPVCFWYLCLKWEGGGVHAFIKTCENDRLQVALGRGGEPCNMSHNSVKAFIKSKLNYQSQTFYIPYTHHYNLWFVYFLPTFWSPKTFFQGAFFLKVLALCMVSIQQQVMMVRVR